MMRNKKLFYLAIVLIIILIIIIIFKIFWLEKFLKIFPEENLDNSPVEFCGSSTYSPCNRDIGCETSGCSGQICKSNFEEDIITTCEWRECYDNEIYELECKCINNK